MRAKKLSPECFVRSPQLTAMGLALKQLVCGEGGGGDWGSVLGTQVSISLQKHEASKLLFLLPPDSAKGWLSHAASQHDQSPGKGQAFLQE